MDKFKFELKFAVLPETIILTIKTSSEKAARKQLDKIFKTSGLVSGSLTLEEGKEMVLPGDNVSIEVELISKIAMEKGLKFAIREGGRTIGSGNISEILE